MIKEFLGPAHKNKRRNKAQADREGRQEEEEEEKEEKMYVTIITMEDRVSSNSGAEIVPTTKRTFECASVDYTKYVAKDLKHFCNIMKDRIHTIISSESQKYDNPVEFVEIVIKPNISNAETWRTYAAVNCIMYIMNNDGKTIDSVYCNDITRD